MKTLERRLRSVAKVERDGRDAAAECREDLGYGDLGPSRPGPLQELEEQARDFLLATKSKCEEIENMLKSESVSEDTDADLEPEDTDAGLELEATQQSRALTKA